MPGPHWSRLEAEALVADYFDMLTRELRGEVYIKAKHRAELARRLDARSNASIEYKHQNVSAVLLDHGLPWIEGYKPRAHAQRRMLTDIVLEHLAMRRELIGLIEAVIARPVVQPDPADVLALEVEPPPPTTGHQPDRVGDGMRPRWHDTGPGSTTLPSNYFERELANTALGLAGEEFVVSFEQERLSRAGADRWAELVEHVSRSRGDGLGFDVLSYETTGEERLIEVKTTRFGKMTPFFVTRNEVAVSSRESDRYQTYRVYKFGEHVRGREAPETRLFRLNGALEQVCALDPVSYRATLR